MTKFGIRKSTGPALEGLSGSEWEEKVTYTLEDLSHSPLCLFTMVRSPLSHWGMNKMAYILETMFSNVMS